MISLLMQMRSAELENPAVPLAAAGGEEPAAPTDAGLRVTRAAVLGHPAVWSCISRISRTIANLPLGAWRRRGEDLVRADDHIVHRLLARRPDPELTPYALKQLLVHDLLFGNAYVYIWRRRGRPTGLWPLDPQRTCPVREAGRLWYGTVLPQSGEVRRLDPHNVIHLKGLSIDGVDGYDVVRTLRHAFALGLGQRKYRGIYFRNNGRPNVALEAPPELSEEARERLVQSWRRAASGLENAHRAVLLEEGVKVHEYGSSARDSQLLDGEEHELVQIANIFCVPASRLGAKTNVSYKSLEQDNRLYYNDAILPLATLIEEEMSEKLFDPAERDEMLVQFDRNEWDWADMATRFSAYNTALYGGWLSRDEVRRFEGLNSIPEGAGAAYYVPQSVALVGAAAGGEDPPDEPGRASADDEARAALAAILERDERRMQRRIAHAAARAARADSARFVSHLDDLEALHGRTVREALAAACAGLALDVEARATALVARTREAMLALASRRATGAALAEAILQWAKQPEEPSDDDDQRH